MQSGLICSIALNSDLAPTLDSNIVSRSICSSLSTFCRRRLATSGFERESLRRLSKLLTARDTSLGVNDEHVITIGSHCAPEEYEPPQRRWMHKDIVRTVPISDSGHSSELVPAARSGGQPSFYEYIYRG